MRRRAPTPQSVEGRLEEDHKDIKGSSGGVEILSDSILQDVQQRFHRLPPVTDNQLMHLAKQTALIWPTDADYSPAVV